MYSGHLVMKDFIQYVRKFTQPISQIANISNILQQTAASAERVFEFLDKEEEVSETPNPVNPENIISNVEFQNVHSYPKGRSSF
jgi:ATP-binding cassette subfamily B multidrug efflux pump